jgi:general secretion pathway protein K
MITTKAQSNGRPSSRDGFIIVAVLWMLGALALLASIYSAYVINTAAGFGPYEKRYRAEALATAAIELAAYQLSSAGDNRPLHGEFSFRLGQANVAASFRSEAERIDLNAAPKELIAGLFSTLGAEPDAAQTYAGRIVAWRTKAEKGDDSDAALYRTAGLKYVPRGARFPHVDELSLVLGLPRPLVERALPFVTVYSGRAQINILDAAPEVIASLPGLPPERLNAVLTARRAAPGDGKGLMALLGPAQANATTQGSQASRVAIHMTFDNGHRMSYEVVILVFDEGARPYSVLSWRDESDEAGVAHGLRTALR